jgi:hypothetical protein
MEKGKLAATVKSLIVAFALLAAIIMGILLKPSEKHWSHANINVNLNRVCQLHKISDSCPGSVGLLSEMPSSWHK